MKAIEEKVVAPALGKRQPTIDGYVLRVDYENQVADIVYFDQDSQVQRIKKDVSLPKDGDGIFRQAVKNGDRVTISFKNASRERPYISTIYRGDANAEDFSSPYGKRSLRQSRLL